MSRIPTKNGEGATGAGRNLTISTGDACENFQIFADDNSHVRIR
jgi:hypothetical protein